MRLASLFILFITTAAYAQQPINIQAIATDLTVTLEKPPIIFTDPTYKLGAGPEYFGEFVKTNFSDENLNHWEDLGNGEYACKIELITEDATSLNFILTDVALSNSARIITYNPNKPDFKVTYQRAQISSNNTLTTFPIDGNIQHVVIISPTPQIEHFKADKAIYGTKSTDGFEDSGNCNINANCPEGEGFRQQQKATNIILVGGNGRCTGTLVNNSLNDGKPYVISAAHCIPANPNTISSWAFGFGYESPDCNNQEVAPVSFTGGQLITYLPAPTHDAALILLDNQPSHPNGVYYAGWNTELAPPPSARVFHHPSGDIKKISVQNSAITEAPYLEDPGDFQTWRVLWDEGTTEGGSSGSALLNEDGKIIGTLTGGRASCTNTSEPDYFAPLKTAFEYCPSDSSISYAPWLDPSLSKILDLDGMDPSASKPSFDLAIAGISNIPKSLCDALIKPSISVYNAGSATISSYTITITELNSGTQLNTQTFSAIASDQVKKHILSAFEIPTGDLNLRISLTGSFTDARSYNNTAEIPVKRIIGKQYQMNIRLDDFGSENRWEIVDNNGTIVAQAGPFGNNLKNQLRTEFVCLEADQCYQLKFYDQYGDGMCCDYGNGSYQFNDENGNTIASGWDSPIAQPPMEVVEISDFCVSGLGIAETSESGFISLFPNPVSTGVLNYSISDKNNLGWNYQILTVAGKTVQQGVLFNAVGQISVTNLEKGMYIVKLSNATSKYQSRVVIQ